MPERFRLLLLILLLSTGCAIKRPIQPFRAEKAEANFRSDQPWPQACTGLECMAQWKCSDPSAALTMTADYSFYCVSPKLSAIQRYQERATKKCLEKYSAEECKPLSFPACDDGGCHQ